MVEVSTGHAFVESVADAFHRSVAIVHGVEVEASSLPLAASLVQRLVMVPEFAIRRPVARVRVGHQDAFRVQPRSHGESNRHGLRGGQEPGACGPSPRHGGQHGKPVRFVGFGGSLPDTAPARFPTVSQIPLSLAALPKVGLVHLDHPVQPRGTAQIREKAVTPQKRRAIADSAPSRGGMQRQPVTQALLVELPFLAMSHVLQIRAAQGIERAAAALRATSKAEQARSGAIAHDALGSAVQTDARPLELGLAGAQRVGNRRGCAILLRHLSKTRLLGRSQSVELDQPPGEFLLFHFERQINKLPRILTNC